MAGACNEWRVATTNRQIHPNRGTIMTTIAWQKWQSISGVVQGLNAQLSDTLFKTGEWLAPLGLRLILAWEF